MLQEREVQKEVATGWSRTWLAKDFEGVSHDGSMKLVHGNVFKLAKLVKHQRYGTFILINMISLLLTAGAFSDIPFGIGLKQRKTGEPIPWDEHSWTLDQFNIVGRQLSATNTQECYPFIIQCFPDQIAVIKKFFNDNGFEDAHEVYWYKRTANVEGMQRHTFAVEVFVVGYKGGRNKNVFNWTEMGLVNPTRRHNLIATKSVRKLIMDEETKQPMNRTQNPLALVSL